MKRFILLIPFILIFFSCVTQTTWDITIYNDSSETISFYCTDDESMVYTLESGESMVITRTWTAVIKLTEEHDAIYYYLSGNDYHYKNKTVYQYTIYNYSTEYDLIVKDGNNTYTVNKAVKDDDTDDVNVTVYTFTSYHLVDADNISIYIDSDKTTTVGAPESYYNINKVTL